ncbi:MAG: hypothetical protein K2X87_05305 [Gemmataceae bacterium]|nr:hypothetical protein [Gemmataceae bacterium]
MGLPGGAKAWEDHGSGIDLHFDLADGSPSMEALKRYVADRNRRDAQKGPR